MKQFFKITALLASALAVAACGTTGQQPTSARGYVQSANGSVVWPKLSVIPTWFLKNLLLRLLQPRLRHVQLLPHPLLLQHRVLLLPRPQLRRPVLLAKKSVFLPMLSSISTKPF